MIMEIATFDDLIKSVRVDETPEKFQSFKDEIISLLIPVLQKLTQLENETMAKERGKVDFDEYRRNYRQIIEPICTEALLIEWRLGSCGSPAKYDYPALNFERISFIMKTAKKAAVEIYYEYGLNKADQFIFTKTDDGWKLNAKKSGLNRPYFIFADGKWRKDCI
jgi:hypothetical protein